MAGVMGSIKEQSRWSFLVAVPLQTSDFSPWLHANRIPSCQSDLPAPCLLSFNSPQCVWGWLFIPLGLECFPSGFVLRVSASFGIQFHIQLKSYSVQLIPLISSLNFPTFALFEMTMFWCVTTDGAEDSALMRCL